MLKKFYIISTSLIELNQQGTHILSNRKFAKGFEQLGYKIVEILNDKDVDKIENNLGNIIILKYFKNREDWNKLIDFGKKFNNLFYILWNWDSLPTPPFKYWIYTFQVTLAKGEEKKKIKDYILFKKHELLQNEKKFIPYRFSSYVDPLSNYRILNNIQKIYDVLYIGAPYEIDKINLIKQNTNIKSFIRTCLGGPMAITGKEFENLYRQSKICLGFMAEANNSNYIVTERVWEAFSLGCMVITNSKAAEIYTNGTAVYYKDEQDFLDKINYYLKNDEERGKKIEEGYKIFEDYGNYKSNAKEFINYLEYKINN